MLPAGFIPGWIQRALNEAHKEGEDLTIENLEPRLKEIINYEYIGDPQMNEYCGALEAIDKAIRKLKGRNGARWINEFKQKIQREAEEAHEAALKAERERGEAEAAARKQKEKEDAIMEELKEKDKRNLRRKMLKEAAVHEEFHKDPEEGDHWMERSSSFEGRRR